MKMKKCWKKLVDFEPILYKFSKSLKSYINTLFALLGLIVLCRPVAPKTFYDLSLYKIVEFRWSIILIVMGLALGIGFLKMYEKEFFDLKWLLEFLIFFVLVAVGMFYSLSYLVEPTAESGLCLSLLLFGLSIDIFYLYPRYLYFEWWKPFIRRIENEKQ